MYGILKLLPTSNLQTVTDCCRFITDSHIFHYKDLNFGFLQMVGTQWLQAFLNLCSDWSSVFYQQNGRQGSNFSQIVYLFQFYHYYKYAKTYEKYSSRLYTS